MWVPNTDYKTGLLVVKVAVYLESMDALWQKPRKHDISLRGILIDLKLAREYLTLKSIIQLFLVMVTGHLR